MILVLPWYPVYHLQTSLRRRLTICGMFLLGGFVVAAGIARVVFISQGVKGVNDVSCGCSSPEADSTLLLTTIPDIQAPAFYWASVQACVGVVSACLPTMRPLFSGKNHEGLSHFLRSQYSRLMSRSTRSTSGDHTLTKTNSGDLGDSKSEASLVRDVKPSWEGKYDASIEAMGMHDIPGMTEGIVVQSSITHEHSLP